MSINTPKKFITTDDSFHLPDTPTSLASSKNEYEKDVIYPLPNTKKKQPDNSANISMNSMQTNSMIEVANKIKYNPLHDSIESFESRSSATANHVHNESIIADFKEIKKMIETQRNEHINSNTDSDLIQKWLEDRKRWDTIQQTYEQKLSEMQNRLKTKTLYFKTELDEVFKRELEYQKEIKNLNQQMQSFHQHKQEQIMKFDHEYKCLSENNNQLNLKCKELNSKHIEKENIISNLHSQLNDKNCILNKLEMDLKSIQQNNNNLLQQIEEINEYKQENERLKHLELTSQNMVERLLKRLEQQIHSTENIQKQLNSKEEIYEKEIIKLEKINAQLQEQVTIFKPIKRVMSSSSSETSIFTLSTVKTATEPKLLINNKFRNNNNRIINELKNEIIEKKRNINEYKHSINSFETIISKQKNTINNMEMTINEQRNNINRLEKTNSDISIQLIQERAVRQNIEKEIKHLKFDNKQLKNNNKYLEQSTDDEIFDHTTHKSSGHSHRINKDQLLLDNLKQLIDKHSSYYSSVNVPKYATPKKNMVQKGNFIHKTMSKANLNNNKRESVRHGRISSMTPVSYVCVVKKNRQNISKKRKKNRNNKIINTSKPKKKKKYSSMRTKSEKLGFTNTNKRKKVCRSASKTHILKSKPCIHHKHWV